MSKRAAEKMRVSFDLDEVLFVSPETHKTEPPLPFPIRRFFPERLRLGTPELIRSLQQEHGCEVWVYTSSFRTERYIRLGLARDEGDPGIPRERARQVCFPIYLLLLRGDACPADHHLRTGGL